MPGLRDRHGSGSAEPSGRRRPGLGWWCFETTTPLTAGTYEAARSAVDCALAATDRGARRRAARRTACAGRPATTPTTSLYGGYCFFNNAAIAAVHALAAGAGSGRRARRRLPPRQRHAADLLRARRRDVRVAARRPGARLPVPHRVRRRDRRRAGERGDVQRAAAPRAPTTTPTSPRSTGRSPRSMPLTRRWWSCRSASTRTSATRCAIWP